MRVSPTLKTPSRIDNRIYPTPTSSRENSPRVIRRAVPHSLTNGESFSRRHNKTRNTLVFYSQDCVLFRCVSVRVWLHPNLISNSKQKPRKQTRDNVFLSLREEFTDGSVTFPASGIASVNYAAVLRTGPRREILHQSKIFSEATSASFRSFRLLSREG